MLHFLSTFRRFAAFWVALLALVVGSCQAQQSLRHTFGLETPSALYKGKAATQTACATAQPQKPAAQAAVAAAEILKFFRKTGTLFPAPDRLFPLPRQGLPAAAAPPFYILFKRLKLHV